MTKSTNSPPYRRKELRDLLAGEYKDNSQNCILQLYRQDDGIHIVNADLDLGVYYEWIIDTETGVVKDLKIDDPFIPIQE